MPESRGAGEPDPRRRTAVRRRARGVGWGGVCLLAALSARPGYGALPARYHQDQPSPAPQRGLVGTSMTDVVWSGRYLWVATERGLARWDPQLGTGLAPEDWLTFTEDQGLGRGSVSALAARGDTVWAATLFDSLAAGVSQQVGSGLSFSVDGGQHWQHIANEAVFDTLSPGFQDGPRTPIQNACFGLAVDGDTVWAAFFAGSSVRSVDFGRTWQRVLPGGGDRIVFGAAETEREAAALRFVADSLQTAGAGIDTVAQVRSRADSVASLYLQHRTFSVAAYGDTVWLGTAAGVLSSFDFGRTWTSHRARRNAFGEPEPGNPAANWVVAVEREVTADGRAVVWTGADVTEGAGQVRSMNFTEDGGRTWTAAGPTFAWDFAFTGTDTIWAGTDDGLLRTPDRGRTWAEVPVVGVDGEVLRPTFVGVERFALPQGPVSLWAGADNGLGRSLDGGQTWAILSFPLKTRTLDAGEFIGDAGLRDETGVRTYAAPSPFAPSEGDCRIVYSLTRGARVSITIYDFAGRKVRAVAAGEPRSGPDDHEERWDGRDGDGRPVANGVYFFRVETDGGDRAFGNVVVLD